MAAFATSVSKFASSKVSPAFANANLVASAPNAFTACSMVKKFPVDLLILSESNNAHPFVKYD